jgi:peptidoglycan/LPS O-acetylase OafA/YrhL
MVVWRGRGIFVLVILVGCLYLIPGIWRTQQGQTWAQATSDRQYGLPFIVGMLVAGLILLAWGIYLNRGPKRPMIERQTGRSYMGRPSHSFMYINMEFWGAAALIGAMLMWAKTR